MEEAGEHLDFACPHCGGPLHLTAELVVECEEKHRFEVAEVLLEQARTSSRATWQAVRALQERARTSRWAAQDPELYGLGDAKSLEASALADEETARILELQAQSLDLTLWRFEKPGESDGARKHV